MEHTTRTNIEMAGLPVESFQIITSYLDFLSLIQFIKACNKTMRHKLLRLGGIDTVQIVQEHPNKVLSKGASHVPWLLVSPAYFVDPTQKRPDTLPDFFQGLKSVFYSFSDFTDYHKNSPLLKLEDLPSSLAHLAWFCESFLPTQVKAPKIKNMFPNLQHLSLRQERSPELFDQLPPYLVSLTVEEPPNNWFDHLGKLPLTLTFLSIGSSSQSSFELPAHRFGALSPNITSLHLPGYHIYMKDTRLDLFAPNITSLTLRDIKKSVRGLLPKSVTNLHLVEDSESVFQPYKKDNPPEWPETVQNLSIATFTCECLPGSASLTSLEVKRLIVATNRRRAALTHSPFLLLPSLVFLLLPSLTYEEHALAALPGTLRHLRLSDVRLDGTSVPKGVTSLETIDEMQKYFWSFPRHYSILLGHDTPISSIVSGLPYLDVTNMRLFKLPGHGISSFLECKFLVSLSYHLLSTDGVRVLPRSLTYLHFFSSRDSPIELQDILDRLPNLKHLCSYDISGTAIGAGQLKIGPSFFPKHKYLDDSSTASTSSGATNSVASTSRILRLPEDAVELVKNQNGETVRFEGIEWLPLHLCEGVKKFQVSEATFCGSYSWRGIPNSPSFEVGITLLDLTAGKFFDTAQIGWTSVFPKLPNSITDLRLGHSYAFAVLSPRPTDPTVELPTELISLTLTFTMPPRQWQMETPFPPKFETLTIRSLEDSHPECSATALRLLFESVTEDLTGTPTLVAKSPKPYSLGNSAYFSQTFYQVVAKSLADRKKRLLAQKPRPEPNAGFCTTM